MIRRRVILAVLAVGCLVVGACGDDGDNSSAESDRSDTRSEVARTDASDARSDLGSDASSDPTATTGVSVPGAGGGGGGELPGGPPPPLSDPEPSDLDANVAVGAFAPALLRADLSQKIVVEVRSQADAAPSQATRDHVVSVLQGVSGKKVSAADGPGVPGGGDHAWTGAEIQQAADVPGMLGQGGGTAVIRLLFLHGSYGGDGGILGVAVRGDLGAIFIDQVRRSAPLLGDSGPIETAVTTHEVGHLLGLVDLYRNTGRADPESPGHSTNPDSVMYWAVESDLIGTILGHGPPTDFDDADRADLAAIQAGE